MATAGGGENINPAYEAFRKHSADLLTAIQDPEVLASELYAENIIPAAVRDAATYMMHERDVRTSNLLMAVKSQIKVDPEAFDVFLSVLAKQPSMSDLCKRIKETYSKSVGQAHLDGSKNQPPTPHTCLWGAVCVKTPFFSNAYSNPRLLLNIDRSRLEMAIHRPLLNIDRSFLSRDQSMFCKGRGFE